MGAFLSRINQTAEYIAELRQCGAAPLVGDPSKGTVFLLDGVGGFLLAPVLARKAFAQAGLPYATYLYDWHRGLRGDLLSDLVCRRLNQQAALRLAKIIRQYHRANPESPIHLLAFSGGTGVAVFAAEKLGRQARIDTLILGCPAISPGYCLDGMLQHVNRCYALISKRDRYMLGLGTTIFGTIDRRFCRAAGLTGFDRSEDPQFTQIHWNESMGRQGHFGHHIGWATVDFLKSQIAPLLDGHSNSST